LGWRILQRWLWSVRSTELKHRVVRKETAFRRNISPPFLGSKCKLSKKPARSRPQAQLVSRLTYSSTLKTEAIYSCETSAFVQITRR
jgi:hypothetical protein